MGVDNFSPAGIEHMSERYEPQHDKYKSCLARLDPENAMFNFNLGIVVIRWWICLWRFMLSGALLQKAVSTTTPYRPAGNITKP